MERFEEEGKGGVPLTPPDCDLAGLGFMPLQLDRLFESDLYALANGNEFRAALTLWGKAWRERPAASLPDNEVLLAKKAGLPLTEWRAVAEMALHGWVKCSDGRLYHPVVAAEALKAWIGRIKHQRKSAKGNASKAGRAFDPAPYDAREASAIAALRRLDPTAEEAQVSHSEGKPPPQAKKTPPSGSATGEEKRSEGTGTVKESSSLRSEDSIADDDGARTPERERGKLEILVDLIASAVASPNLDPSKSPDLHTTAARIQVWIDAGSDLQADIIPTIRRICRERTEPVRSWKYFNNPVREATAKRLAAEQPIPTIAPEPIHVDGPRTLPPGKPLSATAAIMREARRMGYDG